MAQNEQKPAIRFQGFTDAWEQRKLSDLVAVCSGRDYKHLSEGNIPVYGTGGYMLSVSEALSYDRDAIGIGRKGTIDKPYVLKAPFWTVDTLFYAIPEHSECLDFIHDVFQIIDWKKKDESTGVPSLSKEAINETNIMVPKIDEQVVIGGFFARIDNLITLHQRKYDKLVNVKKSMLEKMFPRDGAKVPEIRFAGFTDPWEQRKVGELVKEHNAGIYISKENYGEGTNVIGVGNIYDNDIFNGEIYRLGPVNDSKYILDEGDLIYGESSLVLEGIARTVSVGKNGAGSAFAWHTRRVKMDRDIVDSHFATLELNYHPATRKHLMEVATQTALTGMTTEGYFSAPLFLPSMDEQKKISCFFRDVDNLITLHQRKLEKLKNIKKSMLEKMFV